MVKMMKERVENDGFLGALHALLLMDDTVIFATSRDMCRKKLEVLLDFCSEYGMIVNEKKTKFFVINGSEIDKYPLNVQNLTVGYCLKYLYLGAWFTDMGDMKSVLKLHEMGAAPSVHKFSVFCYVNSTMPFSYKLKVFKAALTSSLLYSSESWISLNVKCIEALYNRMVRILLGVRCNTPIQLCLVEIGLNALKYEINKKRKTFLESKFSNVDLEEPFHIVLDICRRNNTPGYRFLSRSMQENNGDHSLEKIQESLRGKPNTATKFMIYRTELNPGLGAHEVYGGKVYIPDYLRQSFTRIRVMSHDLKVETGRWSRLPRDERVCRCNNETIQDEKHVLLDCPLLTHIRRGYNDLDYSSIGNFSSDQNYPLDLCKYVFEITRFLKSLSNN